jgi:hypothetical protein
MQHINRDCTKPKTKRIYIQRNVNRLAFEETDIGRKGGVDQRHQREKGRGNWRRTVSSEKTHLVRGFKPLAGHKIGNCRLFGWTPEKRDGLNQDCGGVQPPVSADQRNRCKKGEAQNVASDHKTSAIEPISDDASKRAKEDRGNKPHDKDTGDRNVRLCIVIARELFGQGGCGEQS